MKVLLLSDSHGRKDKIASVLERHGDMDAILHLGDFGSDIDEAAAARPGIITEAVRGNNDRSFALPEEKVILLAGKRIFLTHGHAYHVGRDLTRLIQRAQQEKACVALFGHTHVPYREKRENIFLVNPGCLFRPRSLHGATYAILEITEAEINAGIYSV